jgi:hypothetical protein
MSTTIAAPGQVAGRPAVPVGTDTLAGALLPADLILIDARKVDGWMRGDNREVIALVLLVRPTEDRLFWEVRWVGALPADEGHPLEPTQGISLYDRPATVTLLRREPLAVAA